MINFEDHYGKDLPDDLLSPHEINARQFVDMVREQMHILYPDVTFFAYNVTSVEIFQGGEAKKALREWDSPKMEEYKDPDLKKELEEQAKVGDQTDIESTKQAKVQCSMLGDQDVELEEALKKVTLLAAEKGGSLVDTEKGRNVLKGLQKRDSSGGWENLAKEFSLTSNFVFK